MEEFVFAVREVVRRWGVSPSLAGEWLAAGSERRSRR
jgi:hypothetical protein